MISSRAHGVALDARPGTESPDALPRAARKVPLRPFATGDVQSLHRTGNALVLSVVVTLGFGILYWLVAARLYSQRTVGLNAAAISVMMLLGGISQLNLASTLARFVPQARCRSHVLVCTAYAVTVAVAALISVVFLLGVRWWAPRLAFFANDARFFVVFVLATISWCLFNLQDSVLAGIARPMWVPLENGVFAVGKTVLLVPLVGVFDRSGIFLSWAAALLAVVVPVNVVLFTRLLRQHDRRKRVDATIDASAIVRYARGDSVGPLLWLAAGTAMPILVTNELGPVANASFALVWVITHTLYLLASQMAVALVVDTSMNGSGLGERSYRALAHTAWICVPAVCVLLLAAHPILGLFGSGYAATGTTALRLLALSAIPNMVNAVYVGVARVQRRVWIATAVLSSLCVLVLGLSVTLLPVLGVNGVGWAWLVSQTLVAAVVWRFGLRPLWQAERRLGNFPSWTRSHTRQGGG